MKKLVIWIVFLMQLLSSSTYGIAQEEDIVEYDLYVNNQYVESNNTVIIRDSIMLFPFRTIFESLGANVSWDESSRNTFLEYNGNNYICYIKEPNPGHSKYFYVKNSKTNSNIYLTSMSMGGAFDIIDDYTYLYRETAEYLLCALECSVAIDEITKTVYISGN